MSNPYVKVHVKSGLKCSGCGKEIDKDTEVLTNFLAPNTLVWHLRCAIPNLKDEAVELATLASELAKEISE